MTIALGDRIPSVTVKRVTAETTEDIDSIAFVGTGMVAFFTVPGAFTPTCHLNHLPGYIERADALFAAGIDKIVCGAVNDHHVMKAWGNQSGAFPMLEMLSDVRGNLARAMGLAKEFGDLGLRFARSSLLINHGIVESVTLETASGPVLKTGADALLGAMNAHRLVGTA
ncbi:MAG: peroxiredoxin [Cucumibacter sp.]